MPRTISLPLLALCLVAASWAHAAAPSDAQYPSHALRNDQLAVLVYLPDSDRGFYRSTRFDWSGMIARIDYKGHRFFAPWKSPHNPLDSEDVIGPAEEFGMQSPLAFAQTPVGATFIKIGIGHLEKANNEPYGFWKEYKIVKPAPWQIDKTDDRIQFRQVLRDDRGYGYDYAKRIVLLKDEPGFVIERQLKNTGTQPIQTTHYNHNFTMIDDEPIGPAYRLTFPFTPSFSQQEPARLQGVVQLEDKQMSFTGRVAPDKPVWALLEGHKTVADHVITIANTKSGASVKIVGDYAMSRLAFYGAATAACPEPFTEFTLRPGEQRSWQTRYVFAVLETRN